MDLKLIAVIIGGAVSLIGVILKVRVDIRNLKRNLEDSYLKSIFDQRISSYAKAWQITGRLSSLVLRRPSPNRAQIVHTAMEELHDWYNSEGGFLMSAESRSRYIILRKLGWDIDPNLSEDQSDSIYHQLWLKKMDFRISLRKDVFLEASARKHKPEDWHFD